MTEAKDTKITLTIKGARAERGVSLSDFESFIDSFLAALRDYDRAERGEPTRKSGHPDRRAEAVTAFRLVGFQTGSGVVTIEPELVAGEDDQLPVDDMPLSLTTLRALAHDLRPTSVSKGDCRAPERFWWWARGLPGCGSRGRRGGAGLGWRRWPGALVEGSPSGAVLRVVVVGGAGGPGAPVRVAVARRRR
jgi:hypothetical protein